MSTIMIQSKSIEELKAMPETELMVLEMRENEERLAFLNDEDCVYWGAKAYWSNWEGAMLLLNLDCRKAFYVDRGDHPDTRTLAARTHSICEAYNQRYDLNEVEKLKVKNKDTVNLGEEEVESFNIVVKPREFLEWAYSKKLSIPKVLWASVCGSQVSTEDQVQDGLVENYLKKIGAYWEINFGGKVLSGIQDAIGMKCIAELLNCPDQEISAKILSVMVSGQSKGSHNIEMNNRSTEENEEKGMHVTDKESYDVIMDNQTINECNLKLKKLNTEIEQAKNWNDDDSVEKLEQEKDFLIDELASSTNVKGLSRQFNNDSEKARKNISNRISKALGKIEIHEVDRFKNNVIFRHLKNAIRTGSSCSYRPENETKWRVEAQ